MEAYCPNCGEPIQLLIDCSIPEQEYTEDCQVCCRPIQITARVDSEGIPAITVQNESE
ncbi:MAG: CPXCG motif-containing cysteine-rich protein [Pseudohongiellaceae bacterium]